MSELDKRDEDYKLEYERREAQIESFFDDFESPTQKKSLESYNAIKELVKQHNIVPKGIASQYDDDDYCIDLGTGHIDDTNKNQGDNKCRTPKSIFEKLNSKSYSRNPLTSSSEKKKEKPQNSLVETKLKLLKSISARKRLQWEELHKPIDYEEDQFDDIEEIE